MSFSEQMIEKAKADKKRIVLPEGNDERVVKAAGIIQNEGIADVVLIANPEEAKKLAGDVDISGVTIIDHRTSENLKSYADTLYELRKAKGMTPEQALEIVSTDPTFYGVLMIKTGAADGMVSGAIHSTADTLRPALQVVKPMKGVKTVSTFFVMTVPDCQFGDNGMFIFADCGMIIDPTAEELANIAVSSAHTAKSLCGMQPKVALLSFSTKGSAKHENVDKVVEAVKLAKQMAPDVPIDGELQLDAALVPSVASLKAPGSDVAGKANVLIFPELEAGNIGYKLVQRLAKAEALGPIVQGLARPVNDLSRGCSVDDIVKVVAITSVQAQNM